MTSVARLTIALGFAGAMLAPSLASAHVRLVYPPPRYAPMGNDDMNIKTGPCGRANDSRTTDMSRITVLQPGATIMVQFNETIEHPGFYRISFDDDGQDAFVAPTMRSQIDTMPPFTAPVLVDNIADQTGMGTHMYTQMVTLPNVQCERCTLQVIQVMAAASTMSWDPAPDQDIYYTCADIALRGGGGGMGGTSGAGGVSGAGGTAGAGGLNQGGSGGAGGAVAGTGGVATGGVPPTGGTGGSGIPTGGAGGAMATGGTPPGGGTPGAGSPGAGAPAAGAATVADPLEAPGCTCRTVPPRSGGHGFAAAVLGLLGLLVRRRRGSRSAAA